ncbi:MAG: hypothetical protein Q9161_007985 [Pseudevernia consocians]
MQCDALVYGKIVATERISEPWEGLEDGAVFDFDQLPKHGERAVIRYSRDTRLPKDDLDAVFEALKGQDLLRNMLDKPFHVVKIRKQVNDTYLLDLAVDDGKQTVTLDWRQLFSLFFAERRITTWNLQSDRAPGWRTGIVSTMNGPPSVERGCDDCLIATAKDNTEEEESRTFTSEIREQRISNRKILAGGGDAKRHLRRHRIRRLHRYLLHRGLVFDDEFVLREAEVMRRIDDVRFHAVDENSSDDEGSM